MARQLTLPGIPSKPRSQRVWRMQVADAGHMPGGAVKGIQFICPRCGHDTGWIEDSWTITQNRRGLPCPCCNQTASGSLTDGPQDRG